MYREKLVEQLNLFEERQKATYDADDFRELCGDILDLAKQIDEFDRNAQSVPK